MTDDNDDLTVEQTCPRCGSTQRIAPAYADYVQKYNCVRCRQADQEARAMREDCDDGY